MLSVKSYELAADILTKEVKESKDKKDKREIKEIKTETNIKYLNVKLKKGFKNDADIIDIIKGADELCVRILLFFQLFKTKDLEKIEFDFFKDSIKAVQMSDSEILDALNFWKNHKVLDYECEFLTGQVSKGANMDNIISLINNIKKDINIMNMPGDNYEDDDAEELYGFDGIYRIDRTGGNKKSHRPEKCRNCEKFNSQKNQSDGFELINTSNNSKIIENLKNSENIDSETPVLIFDDEDAEAEIEKLETSETVEPVEIIEIIEETDKKSREHKPAVKPQPVVTGSISID